MTRVAVLVGSLREKSLNQRFARVVESELPEGITFEYAQVSALPLFNEDVESSAFPEEAKALKALIEEADGVWLVTPEYNRGYSSAIKNAVDWASRPWGDNSFNGKKVAVAGVSSGPLGTTQAQSQLRNVLIYLNTKVMGQPEAYINGSTFFTEEGEPTDEARELAKKYAAALASHFSSK